MTNYNIEKYVDPLRPLRWRVGFLLFTTILFAFLATVATHRACQWQERAIHWEYQALSGERGDAP